MNDFEPNMDIPGYDYKRQTITVDTVCYMLRQGDPTRYKTAPWIADIIFDVPSYERTDKVRMVRSYLKRLEREG